MIDLSGVETYGEHKKLAQLLNGNEVVTPSKADSALAKNPAGRLAAHLSDAAGSAWS